MVWEGTESWEIFEDYFILTATGFDADPETTPWTVLSEKLSFIPSHYSMYVIRTAGTTDLIDVRLQIGEPTVITSFPAIIQTDSRGPQYTKSSQTAYNAPSRLSEHLPELMRIAAMTVGLGNTLTVTLIGRR